MGSPHQPIHPGHCPLNPRTSPLGDCRNPHQLFHQHHCLLHPSIFLRSPHQFLHQHHCQLHPGRFPRIQGHQRLCAHHHHHPLRCCIFLLRVSLLLCPLSC